MQLRPIGRSDLSVPPFCLGGNVFGWTADEAASFAVLDRLVERGHGFVDTAEVYSAWAPGHRGGESEAVIGRWLASRGGRDRLTIATKVGMEMPDGAKGLSPARIRDAVEGSLRRLGTDVIDLYQAHADDAETPLADTLGAFDALVREGKVRAIGASNYSAERLDEAVRTSEANGLARYECLQPGYNLYDRSEFEDGARAICAAHGLGVIAYFALGAGFLTGKYRTKGDLESRARAGRVGRYMDERGMRILAALDAVAAELAATPAQVALAWVMAQPQLTAPIASATSVGQLDDLLGALDLTLDRGALDRLAEASRPG